jgi:predicted transcriptional regulator
MAKKLITIEDNLLEKVKILAIKRKTSSNSLIVLALEDFMEKIPDYSTVVERQTDSF